MERRTLLRTLALVSVATACGRTSGAPTAAPTATPPTPTPASPSPAATPTAEPSPSQAPPAEAAPLALVCRDAWGARPAVGEMRPHTVTRLTVHHSATRLDEVARGPARLRGHQAFHLDGRGWADLAYHVSIDRGGVLYMGRRWDRAGDTGTDYDPANHFLVLLDGNFDVQEPSTAQLDTATRVLAWAATHFGVGLDTVSGHRDHASTSCPGDALYSRLADLTDGARALSAAGGVVLTDLCGPEARAFVADVEAGRA